MLVLVLLPATEKAELDRRAVSDLFPEPEFRPRVSREMPDFEHLQSHFLQEQEERKARRCVYEYCAVQILMREHVETAA